MSDALRDALAEALLVAIPGYQRWMRYPIDSHAEAEGRTEAMRSEAFAHADAILAHPAVAAALVGSGPEAGLRALFARYIEWHGEPDQWDDEDGWCHKHAPTVSEVQRFLLAATPTASPTDHEHYWVDAPDDETGWHCAICGLTEYPGDPGIGRAASPTATGERDG